MSKIWLCIFDRVPWQVNAKVQTWDTVANVKAVDSLPVAGANTSDFLTKIPQNIESRIMERNNYPRRCTKFHEEFVPLCVSLCIRDTRLVDSLNLEMA